MTNSCVQSVYDHSEVEERAFKRRIDAVRSMPITGNAVLMKDLDALYSKGQYEAVVQRGMQEAVPSGAVYAAVMKALLALQRFEEALELFGRVSIRDEHWHRILHHAGAAMLLSNGRVPLELETFLQEVQACPHDQESYRGLAEALLALYPPRSRFAAALKRLPSTADPRRLLEVLIDQSIVCGDLEEAIFLLQTYATATCTEAFNLSVHGRIAEAERDFEAAEQYYRAVLTVAPNDMPAHALYVFLLGRKERWDEARRCFRRIYEQVREVWQPRFASLRTPLWNRGELSGKSIALDSHVGPGYGDLIQMSRFTAELKQRGAKVTVLARRPIHSLMKQMTSIDGIYQRFDALPQIDCCADYLMLWLLMDTPIPGSVAGYSFPGVRQRRRRWDAKEGLKIGIAWRAQNGDVRNPYTHRSIDLCKLLPLLELPSTEWVSLQYTVTETERKLLQNNCVATPTIPDFLDVADEMSELDLIVSADTSIVHLAGALGMKGYCLLPFSPDWRWGGGGSSCSWYPTIKLMTQDRPGDWRNAIAEVREAIKCDLRRS
jgi:hypothetical protein